MTNEIKRIKDPVKFLRETGLLFEINRRVLHPFGLALEIILVDDAKEWKQEINEIKDIIGVYEERIKAMDISAAEVEYTQKTIKWLKKQLETRENAQGGWIGGIWDYREDPEGMLYGDKTFESGNSKFEKFMKEFGYQKIEKRHEAVGFVYQMGPYEEGHKSEPADSEDAAPSPETGSIDDLTEEF